jgi:hypothetical protein
MERSQDLPEPLVEGGISKAKTNRAQSDVREHGISLEVFGQNGTSHESGGHRGHSNDTQRTVREAGERSRELMQSDRIAVHKEVPAAGFAVLGEVH